MSGADFFEGPEKKLEIDFRAQGADGRAQWAPFPPRVDSERSLLRGASRSEWEHICTLASCTILSVVRNGYFDAYVLSESSLFVYPQKVLIKTCGETTLLTALDAIIALAKRYKLAVESAYYSRQRFLRPQLQKFPHTAFEHETTHLQQLFPTGESYCMGDINGDHWFLFEYNDASAKPFDLCRDRTTEIMMHDLHPMVMRLFYSETYASRYALRAVLERVPLPAARVAAVRAAATPLIADSANASRAPATRAAIRALFALDELFADVVLDDHVFEPCGYSVNGLLNHVYLTIHVTPEPGHSYVSFESNCSQSAPDSLLSWAAATLRPQRMALALFADEAAGEGRAKRRVSRPKVPHYRLKSATHYEFFDESDDAPYDVLYLSFLAKPRKEEEEEEEEEDNDDVAAKVDGRV